MKDAMINFAAETPLIDFIISQNCDEIPYNHFTGIIYLAKGTNLSLHLA